MSTLTPARTYNQNHIPRKYTSGKRRLSIYWTWSYPWESQRDPAAMENRFSTMTEVRNVLWPNYETPEWSAAQFLQGIAGTLELFHRSTLSFQQIAGEATGHPVAVFQRIDQAGFKLPIDERILADTDTLMVFGLDHLLSEQEADGRGSRGHPRVAQARRHLPAARAAPRCRFHRRPQAAADGIPPPRRRTRAAPATLRAIYPFADEGARRAGTITYGVSVRRSSKARRRSRRLRPSGTLTSWVCSRTSQHSISIHTCRTMR